MTKNKIKTIAMVVAIILVVTLAGGWIAQTLVSKKKQEVINTEAEGSFILTPENTEAMCLTVMPLSYSSDDGIATVAENSYILTASNDSGDSSLDKYIWSFEFKDKTSSWANGKSASDYISLTPSSATKTATVSCKQAFGEQMIIKVTSEINRSATATCTVDYVKRITDISFTVNDNRIFVLGSQNTFRLNPVFGVGTLTGEISISEVSVNVSEQIEKDVYTASHAMTGQYWLQTATFSPDSAITPFDLMDYSRGDFPYINDGKLAYNAILQDANPSLAIAEVFYLSISVSYNYSHNGDTVQSGNTATAQHPYSAGDLTQYTVVSSVSVDKSDIAF